MKRIALLLMAGVLSCTQAPVRRPIPMAVLDTLIVQQQKLGFRTEKQTWQATLYTVVQPVALHTAYEQGKLLVYMPDRKLGIAEGPARIELLLEGQAYYYPIWVKNQRVSGYRAKEYRSPKTVNPDSALVQQKIVHGVDRYRNLVELSGNRYFQEEYLSAAPKAGTYLTDSSQPLTAYYVEPGTSVEVPVRVAYKRETADYEIQAGPLLDRFGNAVADGTLVVFTLSNADQVWYMEDVARGGLATRRLSAPDFEGYQVWARVDDKVSKTIKLSRRND